jgi:hypothetical protein
MDSRTSAFEATEIDPTDRTCSGGGWHCAPCICAGNEDDLIQLLTHAVRSCRRSSITTLQHSADGGGGCAPWMHGTHSDRGEAIELGLQMPVAPANEFRHESGGHKYTHAHSYHSTQSCHCSTSQLFFNPNSSSIAEFADHKKFSSSP